MTGPPPTGLHDLRFPEEALTLGKPAPAGPLPAGASTETQPLDPTSPEAALPAPPPGRVLAERYTVLDLLGHGGMGQVLAVYDARLNRRVALKLLRPRWSLDDSDSQVRLLREAQAMAQLNHPNVVQVYDSGRLEDDSVFVAMEYVEGQTLRQWLQQAPRTWSQILRAFLGAGQGLAAAHAAGLVHRDFKPDNVLLGQDGRARVTDFGVAQALSTPDADTGLPREECPLPRTWVEPLTESGRLMGTPRYMAPEQLQGQAVGVRGDLFSFCVALYEALYGQPPFPGDSFSALLEARLAGRITPPPPQAQVPAWVGRAVLRGLKADPLQRPGSMRELLAELENDPAQRRRAWVRAGALSGAVALLLVTSLWGWTRQPAPGSSCEDMDRRLAGIWDEGTKARLERALMDSGTPYARDTFERASRLLDTYSQGWVRQRTAVCELARQDGAAPFPRLAAMREFCLERRLGKLEALTELLTRAPDPTLVDDAVQAVQSLPPLSDCADEGALQTVVPPPEAASARAQAEALMHQLDWLETFHRTGRFKEGLALAEGLRPQVAALGYPPLHGRFLYWSAMLLDGDGDYTRAEAQLREGLEQSALGKDAVQEARSWNLLVTVVGVRQSRHAEALWLELPLRAAAERLGDARHLALAQETLGNVRWMKGEYAQGREHYARALALLEKAVGPEHLETARLHHSLGKVHTALEQDAKARVEFERALAIHEKAQGAEHVDTAQVRALLGRTLVRLGEWDAAQRALEQAQTRGEQLSDTSPWLLAHALLGLGELHLTQHQPTLAVPLLERSHALGGVTCRAEVEWALARALWESGSERARARALALQAQVYYREAGQERKLARVSQWLTAHPVWEGPESW
ncbi:serine/threonine-protein kinase [Hyalangium rubrum]|uniref:Serine/threonine-protein kinase n=1 Tax=Hyalangium rubrum TaxID=3103134 RepID=A0ABU5GZ26_9BACT|nr:serine/threonine-protein kinase [Hyalangium sp. s54d21]MDY7226445.1 serine/threonine-protein kinase [Hyalangium sp. s54d21]